MLLRFLYIIAALLILSVVVVVHEFGHYLAGRLCGIGVVEFAVGFGPKIFGFKRKGIQYSLRAFPLGGFCKFVGEDEDNPAENAMNSKPVWKRFITVVSGPLMNFVFAYIICAVMLMNYAYSGILPQLDSIIADTPAEAAGLVEGDIITEINGEKIEYTNDGALRLREVIQSSREGDTLELTIERDGQEVALELTPQFVTTTSEDGTQSVTTPQIGIQFAVTPYSFGQALRSSADYMVEFSTMMVDALRNLVFKGEGVDEMAGPVGIVSMVSQFVGEGMYMALNFLFIISLNLGIMNLLPLPALDGGRLVFLIVEGIRRRPVPPEKEGMVHAAGFLLLLLLIVFVTYQDITRLITG